MLRDLNSASAHLAPLRSIPPEVPDRGVEHSGCQALDGSGALPHHIAAVEVLLLGQGP
jgi:hypothetical protein